MKINLKFTDIEVEMLKGWQGQCSDGVGENKSGMKPYWNNLKFDNDGITVDDVRPFKDKSEKDIIEKIRDKFIDITIDGLDWLGISELYFDLDKRDNTKLGNTTANSIVVKLGGDENYFDDYV
jgi:hypothetical protein